MHVDFLTCAKTRPAVSWMTPLLPPSRGAKSCCRCGITFQIGSVPHLALVIEYRLPGMGHSVDAVTETRVPAPHGQTGPHLMQIFDIEDGVDEWWLFRCRAHRCDYELFETELPPRYRAIWESALRL